MPYLAMPSLARPGRALPSLTAPSLAQPSLARPSHAELGDFPNAMRTSRQAIALLEKRGASEEQRELFLQNLAAYEAGRPLRGE